MFMMLYVGRVCTYVMCVRIYLILFYILNLLCSDISHTFCYFLFENIRLL